MNKEEYFIETIKKTISDNNFIGDDCAFIKDFELVISQDTLVENVHFKTEHFTPYEIGKKSMLVNISDILASGGNPKYATISISGKIDNNFISEFYQGVEDINQKFDTTVIGGDLTGGDKINISIAILGSSRGRKISQRSNAKSGYIIAVKGIFGRSELGLRALQIQTNSEFIKFHKEPELYPEISKVIATNCQNNYSMMDSSDGLFNVLKTIAISSNVRMDIKYEKIPKAKDDFNLTLFGGEDYAIVGCFSKPDFEKLQELGCDLREIGKVENGVGVFVDNKEIKEDLSYEHF